MVYEGIFPVVPTPLGDDEQVDSQGLQHLIEYYTACGCQGLVALGSGGEFPYFTMEEKRAIIAASTLSCAGRIPLVAGCGFYSLQETLAFIRACRDGQDQSAHMLQEQILDLIPIMNSLYLPSLIQKRAFQALSHLGRPSRSAGTASRHAITKETLKQLGHPISARVRSPLPQITEKERSRIKATIATNTALQSEFYR